MIVEGPSAFWGEVSSHRRRSKANNRERQGAPIAVGRFVVYALGYTGPDVAPNHS